MNLPASFEHYCSSSACKNQIMGYTFIGN